MTLQYIKYWYSSSCCHLSLQYANFCSTLSSCELFAQSKASLQWSYLSNQQIYAGATYCKGMKSLLPYAIASFSSDYSTLLPMLNQDHDIQLIDSSEQKVKARQCSLTCVSEAIPEQRKTHSKEPSQQMGNWHSKWKWHESTIIVREYLNYVVCAQFYGKDSDLFFTRELSCTNNKNAGFPMDGRINLLSNIFITFFILLHAFFFFLE